MEKNDADNEATRVCKDYEGGEGVPYFSFRNLKHGHNLWVFDCRALSVNFSTERKNVEFEFSEHVVAPKVCGFSLNTETCFHFKRWSKTI